ncbi:hypothetical protein MPH_12688 [Macrophomina phaseolina MS6]|uniref:Uncharacterized protein n=1 Tax=Macrophomina phaseolina (strain MS6) TaxID=1126212 RepID=K2R7F9_MACPH|nr:hypothetical protein MPH_12688 [Macrophomina phaseolina MS6]
MDGLLRQGCPGRPFASSGTEQKCVRVRATTWQAGSTTAAGLGGAARVTGYERETSEATRRVSHRTHHERTYIRSVAILAGRLKPRRRYVSCSAGHGTCCLMMRACETSGCIFVVFRLRFRSHAFPERGLAPIFVASLCSRPFLPRGYSNFKAPHTRQRNANQKLGRATPCWTPRTHTPHNRPDVGIGSTRSFAPPLSTLPAARFPSFPSASPHSCFSPPNYSPARYC